MTSAPRPDVLNAEGPPRRDVEILHRIAPRVEIKAIELAGCIFRGPDDDQPFSSHRREDMVPGIGIDAAWEYDASTRHLGVLLSFATVFEEAEVPYSLRARYRLMYAVSGDSPPTPEEAEQFTFYNAVINAWPYWRELVGSTLSRAELQPFLLPVLHVPIYGASEPSEPRSGE